MTKDEALKLALEALEYASTGNRRPEIIGPAITAIKEALAQPEQEPVARVIDNGTPEGATEWIPFTNRVEPLETGDLLYTTPPQPVQPERGPVAWEQFHEHLVERNFCPRCGKRTADPTTIHTCTPPQSQWVGLTDEEVIEISHLALTRVQAMQMTEAKLREKNA